MVLTTQRNTLEDDAAVVSLLEEIVGELRGIRLAIEASGRPSAPANHARHEALVEALADSMDGFDLEFIASEVIERRQSHHELDVALKECRIKTTARLGALFRDLQGGEIAGFRLVRDGRGWRLVRCT